MTFLRQASRRLFSSQSLTKGSTCNSAVRKRTSLATLRKLYESKAPITTLTAYDYPTALHAERAGVDITLVGDSLGMVCLGHRTTQSVTLDDIIHHARAARRATIHPLLVADMPFGCYESNLSRAVDSAVRIVKETAVDAVKLEGGTTRARTASAIVEAGVAVVGHIGLLPQAVSREGSFRAAGTSALAAERLLLDAVALQEAGVFAIVVECVPARVARLIQSLLDIPTIGIGSGPHCDGQVLVYHDMLGILSHPHHDNVAPRFSKQFAKLGPIIHQGIQDYCSEVRERKFPDDTYCPYKIPDDDFEALERSAAKLRESAKRNNRSPTKSNGNAPLSMSDDPIAVY